MSFSSSPAAVEAALDVYSALSDTLTSHCTSVKLQDRVSMVKVSGCSIRLFLN